MATVAFFPVNASTAVRDGNHETYHSTPYYVTFVELFPEFPR